MRTQVIFRKYKNGVVIAIFPYEVERDGAVMSYMHVGQHSKAYLVPMRKLKLATAEEAMPLFEELQSIGYELQAIKRVNYTKYMNAYRNANL